MKIEIISTANDSMKASGFGWTYKACKSFYTTLLDEFPSIRLTICRNKCDLDAVIGRKPDFVILTDKRICVNDGQKLWLSDFFDKADINYTGSKMNALQFDFDKKLAKKLISSKKINTADFFTAVPNEYNANKKLPFLFPLFLKPINSASGNGIDASSLVYDFNQFENKVEELHKKYHYPVLVETYLNGREFTVAVSEINSELTVYALEIIAPIREGIKILSAKVKQDNAETLHIVTNKSLLSELSNIAKKSFIALGARDFGRIDIKMDDCGQCHFLEANLTPGMSNGSSYFPQACKMNAGLDYNKVAHLVIHGAIERANKNISLKKF